MTIRFKFAFLAIPLVGTLGGSPALACALPANPQVKINGSYFEQLHRGVVLVRVVKAGYTDKARPDSHPWEATAVPVRVLMGFGGEQEFKLFRSGSSSACDDLIPSPRPGDLWVVYVPSSKLDRQFAGQLAGRPYLTYPLAVALENDPRLAAAMKRAHER